MSDLYNPQTFVWMLNRDKTNEEQIDEVVKHLKSVAMEHPSWVIKLELFEELPVNTQEVNDIIKQAEDIYEEAKIKQADAEVIPVGVSKNGFPVYMTQADVKKEESCV